MADPMTIAILALVGIVAWGVIRAVVAVERWIRNRGEK
jgi:hypothetical protein